MGISLKREGYLFSPVSHERHEGALRKGQGQGKKNFSKNEGKPGVGEDRVARLRPPEPFLIFLSFRPRKKASRPEDKVREESETLK